MIGQFLLMDLAVDDLVAYQSAGPALGVRRLLVPVLDLANHDGAEPSALYAYSGAGRTGDCIRLHAARPLRAGDAGISVQMAKVPNQCLRRWFPLGGALRAPPVQAFENHGF